MRRSAVLLLAVLGLAHGACTPALGQAGNERPPRVEPRDGEAVATLAGGCFWCMEPPFEGLSGVRSVLSGYTGGPEKNPSYKAVSSGSTGHTEAVQIVFDPRVISYETLLEVFFRSMDPTDKGGQFADRGTQYRPGIFYHDAAQQRAARAAIDQLASSGRFNKPIVVEVTPYSAFYPAETYHQDYYKKDPAHYKRYRKGSGRTGFLERVWGGDPLRDIEQKARSRYSKPPESELRKRLTALQYRVTQQDGTERPFHNAYWDNKAPGLYVDVVSGEPLFSSRDKFESGTGWPSFARPLVEDNIVEHTDSTLGMKRVEVRSKHGDSHLGHVFSDGPAPTGLRYCINSAALRFIPADQLGRAGYKRFQHLFR